MNLELATEHIAPLFLHNNKYLEQLPQLYSNETDKIKRKIREINVNCSKEQVIMNNE